MMDDNALEARGGSGWQLPVIIVLGLVALGGLLVGWRANAHLSGTEQAVNAQVTTMQQGVDRDVSALKDRLVVAEKSNNDLQSDLKVVTKKLSITEGQLRKAREEASKLQEETSARLTDLDTSVKGELATKANSEDLKNVDTKVGGVRTDLDATREDLKMARSEMGTLIARNHEEIDQLRRLGERDYIEFTIAGKSAQKVGNITVELRGTNPKKNQFSVLLTIEDKRFEKKNRALNEPIFFHTTGNRQPEEIVINKVSKDQVSGYLSVSKAGAEPASQASTSSGQ
jgi:chromosome segregation ATPase